MTNLSSIIALLQLVLGLLSNPAMANNSQAQALANQAISMATQALGSSVATTTAPTTTPPPANQPTTPQTQLPTVDSIANVNGSTTSPVTTVSTTSTTAGTCQLTIQNLIENWNGESFTGTMSVSKKGGTEDGVSLYAAAPNGNGYLSGSTKWIGIMNPIINAPQTEPFNYVGSVVPYDPQNITTTEPIWFKASYPDGTVCYDPNEQIVIPSFASVFGLKVLQNGAVGSQNVGAGMSNLKIGSYSFVASSNQGVNINTVSIKITPNVPTAAFQNLKIVINGMQFGTTQSTVNGNTTYSFSGSAFNVPAGQTVNVDVYADSLSNASGTYSPATALVDYTASGATSYWGATNTTGPINGQTVNITSQTTSTTQ